MVEAAWVETERAGGRKGGIASQTGSDKTEGERETGPRSAPALEVLCCSFLFLFENGLMGNCRHETRWEEEEDFVASGSWRGRAKSRWRGAGAD